MTETTKPQSNWFTAWLEASEKGQVLDAAPTGPVDAQEIAAGEVGLPAHEI